MAGWLVVLAAALLAVPSQAAAEVSSDRTGLFAVWITSRGKTPPEELKRKCPWLRGALVQLKWHDLEPASGHFAWAYLDSALGKYADAGFYVTFQVWAGPASPDWVYDAGVPRVKTSGKGDDGVRAHDTFPYYLDPHYKTFYERMIRAVAAHVDALPKALREKIVCIQSAEGSTGDVAAYKGAPLDKKYEIDEPAWDNFKRETWALLDQLYRDKTPAIHLLITVGAREDENQGNSGWLMQHLPSAWRKATGPCQMYQMRGEDARLKVGDPLYFTPDANGNPRTRCRGELSVSESGWFAEAPVWNTYWMNLWVLHFGVDMFMVKSPLAEDPRHREGLSSSAATAGSRMQRSPRARGAPCAMDSMATTTPASPMLNLARAPAPSVNAFPRPPSGLARSPRPLPQRALDKRIPTAWLPTPHPGPSTMLGGTFIRATMAAFSCRSTPTPPAPATGAWGRKTSPMGGSPGASTPKPGRARCISTSWIDSLAINPWPALPL
jgi:hypothetical protein